MAKRKMLIAVAGAAVIFGASLAIRPANATLIGVDIAAIIPAGNSNNDDVGLTVTYLRSFFNNPNIVYLGTIDGPGNNAPNPPAGENINGTSLNSDLNGTWTSNLDLVYAFDVKASNHNALESVVPPALGGTWSTSDITNNGGQHPAESHIDFFGAVAQQVDVPEPASLALLGAALLGFGVLRRRQRS